MSTPASRRCSTPRFADPQTSQEIDNISEWQKCRDFMNRSGKKFSRKTGTGQEQHRVQAYHSDDLGSTRVWHHACQNEP